MVDLWAKIVSRSLIYTRCTGLVCTVAVEKRLFLERVWWNLIELPSIWGWTVVKGVCQRVAVRSLFSWAIFRPFANWYPTWGFHRVRFFSRFQSCTGVIERRLFVRADLVELNLAVIKLKLGSDQVCSLEGCSGFSVHRTIVLLLPKISAFSLARLEYALNIPFVAWSLCS